MPGPVKTDLKIIQAVSHYYCLSVNIARAQVSWTSNSKCFKIAALPTVCKGRTYLMPHLIKDQSLPHTHFWYCGRAATLDQRPAAPAGPLFPCKLRLPRGNIKGSEEGRGAESQRVGPGISPRPVGQP